MKLSTGHDVAFGFFAALLVVEGLAWLGHPIEVSPGSAAILVLLMLANRFTRANTVGGNVLG